MLGLSLSPCSLTGIDLFSTNKNPWEFSLHHPNERTMRQISRLTSFRTDAATTTPKTLLRRFTDLTAAFLSASTPVWPGDLILANNNGNALGGLWYITVPIRAAKMEIPVHKERRVRHIVGPLEPEGAACGDTDSGASRSRGWRYC